MPRLTLTIVMSASVVLAAPAYGRDADGPDAADAPRPVVGRVVDAAGKPVQHATVFALREFMGGIRTSREYLAADVGADGGFEFPVPPAFAERHGHTHDVGFLAHATGRPPVPLRRVAGPVVLADPGAGGSLVVGVVRDGRPVAGATVALAPRHWGEPFEDFQWGAADDVTDGAVAAVLFPTRTTDARGHATFDDLLPGVYDARAYVAPDNPEFAFSPPWAIPADAGMPMNDAFGLAVVAGARRSHTIALRDAGPFAKPLAWRPEGSSRQWEAGRRGTLDPGDEPPGRVDGGFGEPDWVERTGTVVMADGRTPALGAVVLVFGPAAWGPEMDAVADARGAFVTGPRAVDGLWPKPEPPGSPGGLALLAWLPGSCGAVVVPLPPGKAEHPPLKIVLPRPVSFRGRVTVRGEPLGPALGTARVIAEHRGRGKLDAFMTVEATAEPDGAFELRGLTPGGDYRVVAVLDESFRSRKLDLRVAPDVDPAAITLDVERPR